MSNGVLGLALLGLFFNSANGYARINLFAEVAPNIYRGAQPEDDVDYGTLESLHVKTIINLREPGAAVRAEKKIARLHNMTVINIPIGALRSPSAVLVSKAVALMSNPSLQPVFVHCKRGRDRTGLIIGMYRVFEQYWPPRTAYAEMLKFKFSEYFLGLRYFYWKHTGYFHALN